MQVNRMVAKTESILLLHTKNTVQHQGYILPQGTGLKKVIPSKWT